MKTASPGFQGLDYSNPFVRLMSAPTLAHARRCGAILTPEMDSVANEDTTELRELRAEQWAATLPPRGSRP